MANNSSPSLIISLAQQRLVYGLEPKNTVDANIGSRGQLSELLQLWQQAYL